VKKYLMPVIVLALCAAFVGAGCGGDDDETTTATTTTETGATGASGASGEQGQAAGGGTLDDAFAEEANAVCEQGNKELDQVFGSLDQEPKPAELEKLVSDEFVPNVQGQIDDIKALGEPEEGSAELQTFLDDAQSALDEVESDPSLIGPGAQQDPFADVNKQAKELGLPACAG
jgi:hypothetical protein